MTITRTYSCNLCRNMLSPDALYGIYFESSGKLIEKDSRQVENHICQSCLMCLAVIASETKHCGFEEQGQ